MEAKDLENLRDNTPILEVARYLGLEIRGNQAKCYNAQAHNNADRKPSLGLDIKTNRFKCFACGVSGSVIDLYMEVRGVDFKTALVELNNMYGTPTLHATNRKPGGKLSRRRDISNTTVYETLISLCPPELDKQAIEYLTGDKRGLSLEAIRRHKLIYLTDYDGVAGGLTQRFDLSQLQKAGVFNDKGKLIFYRHRLIVPFYENDKVTYLQGRALDETNPKYLNLTGVEKPIFNLDMLQSLGDGVKVYICEGVFDAMRLIQEGYNAVGLLGVTDFTDDDVGKFSRFGVILALDNDEPGKKMAKEIAGKFIKQGKRVKLKQLPEGVKDITDYFLYA